jgi:trans-aconitate 2-methyltransferase
MWDPAQYLQYADERSRPFYELVARVTATNPRRVVDLGCGPGNLTVTLTDRWPQAYVEGVDSSPEMIEKAVASHAGDSRITFQLGDIRDWRPREPVDVLLSNAALHWVPGHLELLAGLVSHVAESGWFAFQVPGNFDEPSHAILRSLSAEPRWGLGGAVAFPSSHQPVDYVDVLTGVGARVDVWETTYLHLFDGPDPVFEWINGTYTRPVLAALDQARRAAFTAEFKERLRAAYPRRPYGTVLPVRGIFVVARKGVTNLADQLQ